jgi:hypothetical protein
VSFGIVCGGVCCLIIFVFGTATVRVTVFVSGLAIFFANATLLALDVNYFAVEQRYRTIKIWFCRLRLHSGFETNFHVQS